MPTLLGLKSKIKMKDCRSRFHVYGGYQSGVLKERFKTFFWFQLKKERRNKLT
jgi:hypothetical protein